MGAATTRRPSTSAASVALASGTDDALQTRRCRRHRHREHARRRDQLALQRQLAAERVPVQSLGGNLRRGGQHAERHRQVEARPVLPDVRRREVHHHASQRPHQAGRSPPRDARVREHPARRRPAVRSPRARAAPGRRGPRPITIRPWMPTTATPRTRPYIVTLAPAPTSGRHRARARQNASSNTWTTTRRRPRSRWPRRSERRRHRCARAIATRPAGTPPPDDAASRCLRRRHRLERSAESRAAAGLHLADDEQLTARDAPGRSRRGGSASSARRTRYPAREIPIERGVLTAARRSTFGHRRHPLVQDAAAHRRGGRAASEWSRAPVRIRRRARPTPRRPAGCPSGPAPRRSRRRW